MIAVMLEVTAVYRVVSLSGIFIATGLVVLLVVTLIQTMDRIRELELARQREARESLDYLTGLPMRHKGEALILEKMQKHGGCLGFVDMDNLKKINDVYGHKAGDRALRLVGEVLTECMENAVVCRLGGDEFLFYLPEVSEAEINMRVRKLFDSFRAAKNAASLPAVSAQPAAVANKESTKEDTAMKKTLKVEGMMCGHCEARVKKALEALPEVDEAVVSHEAGTAIVTLNAEVADDVLKNAVEAQDYKVTGIQ